MAEPNQGFPLSNDPSILLGGHQGQAFSVPVIAMMPSKALPSKRQKSYVLPHMRTLDQGQTQQGD
jgi:hypothetical protein